MSRIKFLKNILENILKPLEVVVKNFWIKSSQWTCEVINKTFKMCIIFTIKNTKIKENILKAYIEKNKWIELVMCKEKAKKKKKWH